MHCCEEMRAELDSACERHPERHDCPDALVSYSPRFREYGLLIHDGGSSFRLISHCPWCGAELPGSLRDAWFARLESLGLESDDTLPAELTSDAWWQTRALPSA
jgi:hypothetical protein